MYTAERNIPVMTTKHGATTDSRAPKTKRFIIRPVKLTQKLVMTTHTPQANMKNPRYTGVEKELRRPASGYSNTIYPK